MSRPAPRVELPVRRRVLVRACMLVALLATGCGADATAADAAVNPCSPALAGTPCTGGFCTDGTFEGWVCRCESGAWFCFLTGSDLAPRLDFATTDQ